MVMGFGFFDLILFDSIIVTGYFVYSTLTEPNKNQVVKKVDELYFFTFIERYMIYYIGSLTVSLFGSVVGSIMGPILLLPFIQNRVPYKVEYREKLAVTTKYFVSEYLYKKLRALGLYLDKRHTITIIKYLNYSKLVYIFKQFLFVHIMYLLYNNERLYFYYKTIKLTYLYNFNYSFTRINKKTALLTLQNLIKNDYNLIDITNVHHIHCLYVLIRDSHNTNLMFELYKWSSIWVLVDIFQRIVYFLIATNLKFFIALYAISFTFLQTNFAIQYRYLDRYRYQYHIIFILATCNCIFDIGPFVGTVIIFCGMTCFNIRKDLHHLVKNYHFIMLSSNQTDTIQVAKKIDKKDLVEKKENLDTDDTYILL